MHPAEADETTRLRQESDRIEELLTEVSSMAGPQTWRRVEELLHRTVALYGAGIGRVLSHVMDAGAASEELKTRLCQDELVASLLLLHGLHPRTTEDRVRQATDELHEHLGRQGTVVELLAVEGEVVKLKVAISSGCGSTRKHLEEEVRRVIFEAAPEVARIDLEGEGDQLVQIDLHRPPGVRP